MRYETGGRKCSHSEALITFMVFDYPGSATESAIVRGLLTSRGVPFFFFARTKANPATIRVPASHLEDARRALAQARRIGSEIQEMRLFNQ